jgi:hypothetical protein
MKSSRFVGLSRRKMWANFIVITGDSRGMTAGVFQGQGKGPCPKRKKKHDRRPVVGCPSEAWRGLGALLGELALVCGPGNFTKLCGPLDAILPFPANQSPCVHSMK